MATSLESGLSDCLGRVVLSAVEPDVKLDIKLVAVSPSSGGAEPWLQPSAACSFGVSGRGYSMQSTNSFELSSSWMSGRREL